MQIYSQNVYVSMFGMYFMVLIRDMAAVFFFPADVWVDRGADKTLFIPPLRLLVLIPPHAEVFAF